MRARQIGGENVSVVGLGTWAIGGWMWGGSDEKEAIRAIHAALDCGINLIDTAPAYGMGRAEELVGKALSGRRKEAYIATKCGLIWHEAKGSHFFDTDADNIRDGGSIQVFRYLGRESIRYEIEQSLRRLQTDYIDLYQTHWQDFTTPIAETMQELLLLKKEGKIRAIGCSNATPKQMAEYRMAGGLDSDQELYNMLDRQIEQTNLPDCAKNGTAFLSYSSLAQGLLTGKIGPERVFAPNDQRSTNPRFSQENRKFIKNMLDAIEPIASAHKLTQGQLATVWTISQPGCTHTLVGARSPEQVCENASIGMAELQPQEQSVIRNAIREYELVASSHRS